MDQASSLRKLVYAKKATLQQQASVRQKSADSGHQTGPRVISITSGKGGVGKTNIVGNLAIAFTRLGKRVLIFDADLGLANIDIIFSLYPKYNIGHVINGEKSFEEVIVKTSQGIQIIPAGSGVTQLTHLSEGQKLSLLSEFETLDTDVDIFLIDTGAGISSNVLYFNLAADECYVVATSEPTSLTDAYAMIKVMATQHGSKYFKLLVNMVENEKEAKQVYLSLSQAVDRFLDGVIIEYVGFVPSDVHVRKAVQQRKTVMDLYPESNSGHAYQTLAKAILNTPRRQDADGNIKFFFKRFMSFTSSPSDISYL